MELIFLGTSAGVPTRTRNVSAILLDLQHPTRTRIWLFDCGEGTQHQLLRTTRHLSNLEKIFVTHLHGDHIFGLSSLDLILNKRITHNSILNTTYKFIAKIKYKT